MKIKASVLDLETAGFVNVPYPASLRSSVRMAVQTWQDFCCLGKTTKQKFPYREDRAGGVGYELKERAGSTLDLKENFQFTRVSSVWLRETAVDVVGLTPIQLVGCADGLVGLIQSLVVNFAREAEESFALGGLADEVILGRDQWIVRFLHYFGGRKVGDEIATPHADKSGLSLHLYESDPGLQCLGFDGEWRDMPVSDSETVIIPGMRMQFRSKGDLKALCHRVVATPETARTGRYSIVCFIPLINTPAYNKVAAGRLQEFPPGFNYTMPFEEFRKLFA